MRLSIALLTTLTAAAGSIESHACGLTDYLFGRRAPQVVGYAPYAAGYAPITASPYAAGYAPSAAGYAPSAAGYAPSAAGYAPSAVAAPVMTLPVGSTSVLPPALNSPQLSTGGVYQAQRPGYYDNPSVYTGLPVVSNAQTLYRVPMTSFRGTGTQSAYFGAANQYPLTYSSAYRSNYAAAQVSPTAPGLPLPVTAPTGAPVTAIAATPVAPLYPATPPRRGGLARFFGSLFGTNYRSSYYRAPITYYRPVTSLNPATGTAVIVQQPCTSYVQQLQRTPYGSLQMTQGAFAQPGASCQPTQPIGSYGAVPYGAVPYGAAPSTMAPASGIGQVGGVGAPGQRTVPIPSTVPATSGSIYAQPSYGPAPLTGAPPAAMAPGSLAPAASPPTGGDLAPVDQPRLENYAPQEKPQEAKESSETSGEKPGSYWELQKAEDSTAMIRPGAGQFTGIDPIEAPEDYDSPFRSRQFASPPPATATDRFEAPPLPARPLPARSYDPSEMTSASTRVSVPVRDATLIRAKSRTTQPKKRKTVWRTIQP